MQIVMTKQIHNGGGAVALDSGMRQKHIHNGGGTIALDSGMRQKKRGRNRYRTVVVVGGGGGLDSGMRQKRILSLQNIREEM